MNLPASEHRGRLGFLDGERGAHSHATLMVRDLAAIFGVTTAGSSPGDYGRVVVEDDVLGKRTAAARKHTLNNLVNLYGLDPGAPVFRIFRELWDRDAEGRPLLALYDHAAR